ncbi:MAG: hypothetical protein R3C24_15700 [Cyanobacteriota/Melainabacteria group bacterium]
MRISPEDAHCLTISTGQTSPPMTMVFNDFGIISGVINFNIEGEYVHITNT